MEYKLSHYLDKAMESLFSFNSVLPGAFSTFRWEAIQGGPLMRFFDGLNQNKHSCFEANMYLAEDRIMCLEILIKRNEKWVLKYIPGCKALTDPPENIMVLMKQRRRWINGSIFAAFYCIINFCKVTDSGHGVIRVITIYLFFAYYIAYFIFTIIMVGSFYAAIRVLLESYSELGGKCDNYSWVKIMDGLYLLGHLFLIIVCSTMNIMDAGKFFKVFVNIFGLYMSVTIGLAIYTMVMEKDTAAFIALVFGIGFFLANLILVFINYK